MKYLLPPTSFAILGITFQLTQKTEQDTVYYESETKSLEALAWIAQIHDYPNQSTPDGRFYESFLYFKEHYLNSNKARLTDDGEWENMVQKEIDAFFNETTQLAVSKKVEQTGDYWQRKQYLVIETSQSPFRALVWSHCSDLTYEILKEKVNKEYFSDVWNGNGYDIKEGMKEVISEAAPLAAAKFFESLSYGMMNDLRNKIGNLH